ncbi:hypothetical protein CPB86DRAFT_764446 [Serendipita vermifera]|nr:hypothetical protein CPB86DRAFT_764446 [Serendipita vermifera]
MSRYRQSRDHARDRGDLLQLSGRNRHIEGYPSTIAQSCFQKEAFLDTDGQVQLILGIKSNGESEFLVPMRLSTLRRMGSQNAYEILDPDFPFASLSPVTFATSKLLEDTLTDHMPRAKGKGSRSNRRFELSTKSYDRFNVHGRCFYEGTRLLVRHMFRELPYPPSFYGLMKDPANSQPYDIAEFLLISYNEFRIRSVSDFLDMAWGKVGEEEFNRAKPDREKVRPTVMKDLDFQNDMFRGDSRGPRAICHHVTTSEVEDLKGEATLSLKQYLQRFLSRPSPNSGAPALYVLVHGWNQARDLLSKMNIDTSHWTLSLFDFLTYLTSQFSESQRDRSRSPSSRESKQLQQAARRTDSYSNPKIYVIDTMQLYQEARRIGDLSRSLVETCQDFELPDLDDHRTGEWCAGNEIMYLWSLFFKMAYGPNINDIYKTQFKVDWISFYQDEEEGTDNDGSEELFPSANPRATAVSAPKRNPYDDLENGDDIYGSD